MREGRGAQLERPLVVRCGAFGDMVLLTALIRPLHARFRCPIDILTSGPWSEPLLRGQPGVGEILTVRSRKTPYWLSLDQQRAVRALKARGPGPTWFCDGNDAALPILHRAGIPDDFLVTAKEHRLKPGEHATEQWRRLSQILPGAFKNADLPAIDLQSIPPGCSLQVSEAQRSDLQVWLKARGLADQPLILVQVGNKRTMRRGFKRLAANNKYWPYERWAEVLRFLSREYSHHAIVLLGTGPEYQLNQEIARLAAVDRLHNAADGLPVPRLLALLERGDGLITVDSGPAHAAAAVGCPQVTLFGKALISLYRPWGAAGADVKVVSGELDGEPSMLGIQTQAVIDAWRSLKLRSS
jgi:ADP-heptose:LPS heptosyltransferase